MKFSWKAVVALVCRILGTISWIYIGVFRFLSGPVKNMIAAKVAGKLSISLFIICVVKGFGYLTLAGAVWCVWDILTNYFKRK